jgi:Co/Zn/Cd efflux system component
MRNPVEQVGRPVTSHDFARLRSAVRIVALANLGYFAVEFAVATAIGSVALFADSIDFLEDASLNALILFGLYWTARARAQLGMVLAAVLLVPGVATLWSAWHAWHLGQVPAPVPLTLAGLGALVVNVSCAVLLARVRHVEGSLTRAAFLSARNDVFANLGIIGAGFVTALTRSLWPDLLVGLGIFVMNLDAAREVYAAARAEHARAQISRP